MMNNEKELWNAFVNGSELALKHLYDTFFDDLFNIGKKYSSDLGLIEDSIQDVYINIWQTRTKINEPKSIKAYLITALRNKIYDRYRKNKNFSTVELTTQDMETDDSFEALWISEENHTDINKKLEDAIAKLSNKQKEIIYLKYEKELSYEEIGDILSINYQSARNLVHRTIVELRKGLKIVLIFILLSTKESIVNLIINEYL
jgi:RNA polymerase sigma factor (sigma-70 family)